MKRMTHMSDGYYAVDSADCWEDQNEEYSGPAIDRLAAYEDTGLEPENMAHWEEWFQAECDDRLVALPCKVGDTVYLAYDENVIKAEVTCMRPVIRNGIEFRGNAIFRYEVPPYYGEQILYNEIYITFGKDAFLTREEAEAALEAQKGGCLE